MNDTKPYVMDWAKPDYTSVFEFRLEALKRIRANPSSLARLMEYYSTNWVDFINDWGMTYDPRAPVNKYTPFILFPRQEDFVKWIYESYMESRRGLGEKSRDVGFTWLCAACAVCIWLFYPSSVIGFGSRKKELVDNGDHDPDSIFWKVRTFIDNLPAEFLPPQYTTNRKWGIIPNPANNSVIKGEIGDEIGRGGRAQPVDSLILTPTGWMEIGDITAGMEVIGASGEAVRVLAVHPQGILQTYKVTFSDGTSTECCDEHIWQVTTPAIRKSLKRQTVASLDNRNGRHKSSKDFELLSLREIRKDYLIKRTDIEEAKYHIPITKPVFFHTQRGGLPLNPYILGVLLGDGSVGHIDRTAPQFTSADPEMAILVGESLPPDCKISWDGKLHYNLVDKKALQQSGRGYTSRIKNAIYAAGLADMTALNKSIPQAYLYGTSPDIRLDILQGLIDTDGWISTRGKDSSKVCFSSSSKQLAKDVVTLVQSLGGVAGIYTRKEAVRKMPGGGYSFCQKNYIVTISMPDGMLPAKLSRKVNKYQGRPKYAPIRAIKEIIPSRKTECVCLTVEGGLYLTNDFIVTHNSGIYFVDEFAHLEHPDMAESALSANTNCRIYISTVNGIGNLFYRLRHFLPKEQIFIFDWKDDPRKRLNPELPPEEEPWYKQQKRDLLPTTLASQVDRNYAAAVSNTLVNAEKLAAATQRRPGSISQPDKTPWRIGVDAAGLGNDEIIIWARRGRLSIEPEAYRKLDGIQLATIIEYKVKRLLNTGPVELIAIERDGPGGSAADQLKYGPFASIVKAVHTGAKLADSKNYNLRAYLHSQAVEYIEDLEISLPDDDIFKAQAIAIQYDYKGGLLLIESKDEYRARFAVGRSKSEVKASRSPDRWDAFVLTFVPTRAKPIMSQADNMDFKSVSPGWRPLDAVMGY